MRALLGRDPPERPPLSRPCRNAFGGLAAERVITRPCGRGYLQAVPGQRSSGVLVTRVSGVPAILDRGPGRNGVSHQPKSPSDEAARLEQLAQPRNSEEAASGRAPLSRIPRLRFRPLGRNGPPASNESLTSILRKHSIRNRRAPATPLTSAAPNRSSAPRPRRSHHPRGLRANPRVGIGSGPGHREQSPRLTRGTGGGKARPYPDRPPLTQTLRAKGIACCPPGNTSLLPSAPDQPGDLRNPSPRLALSTPQ